MAAALRKLALSAFRLRPLSLLGFFLLVASFWARLPGVNGAFDFFDQGLILTNANLIRMGGLPYRDFYTNYGPGTFLLAAALWKVLGIEHLALALRVLALVTHLAISLLGGRLAGRIARRAFSFLACGLVSLWLVCLGDFPYAWMIGLALALGFIELLHTAIAKTTRKSARLVFVLAGFALGLAGCTRHDLLVYLTLSLAGAWALPDRAYRLLGLPPPPRRQVGWMALGAASILVPVWIPVVVKAGLHRVIDDLFLTQVHYVMPGRVLPLPKVLARNALGQWVIWRSRFEGAVALTFAGPATAALILAARRPLRIGRQGMVVVSLGCLAVAVLPQMMGRTDWVHAVFTVAPALILLSALLEIFTRRYSPLWFVQMPVAVAMVAVLGYSSWPEIWPPSRQWPRYTLRPSYRVDDPRPGFYEPMPEIAEARQAVLDFIAHHTVPGDAIHVGTQRHDRVHANETDLYFLANRRAGTRYTQFDPNVVTREEVQREMIASLERNSVRVLVLSNRLDWYESQPGVLPGSLLLDQYIQQHFTLVESHPPYLLYTRID